MVPLCCCFSWLLFAWKVGESLFYLWCHSFFNGERGGNVLSNLTFPPQRVHSNSNKVWFQVRPFLSQKIKGGGWVFFLESGLFGQKEWQAGGRQRSYQSDTFSKKRRLRGNWGDVKDVFERMDFRGGGGERRGEDV